MSHRLKAGALIILSLFLTVYFIIDIEFIKPVLGKNNLEPIRHGKNKDYIAFTCNVDWGNEYILPMLKILNKNDVKITFFVSGRWSSNNPDLLKEIYNKGHEIGNHGFSHRMHSKISYEENIDEIKKTHEIVKNIIGIDMVLFAPPAGDFDEVTLKAANFLGYKTILWNIDTIDWRKDSTSEKIINRVFKKPLKGSIVLMHPKEETVKALPEIIKKIQELDLNIGTVTNVIE